MSECHYAECHYTECRYAECHYAECRYAECCYMINVQVQGPFLRLILFVTYKYAKTRVLHYTWHKMLSTDKHPSLLCPFVSYEDEEV